MANVTIYLHTFHEVSGTSLRRMDTLHVAARHRLPTMSEPDSIRGEDAEVTPPPCHLAHLKSHVYRPHTPPARTPPELRTPGPSRRTPTFTCFKPARSRGGASGTGTGLGGLLRLLGVALLALRHDRDPGTWGLNRDRRRSGISRYGGSEPCVPEGLGR